MQLILCHGPTFLYIIMLDEFSTLSECVGSSGVICKERQVKIVEVHYGLLATRNKSFCI